MLGASVSHQRKDLIPDIPHRLVARRYFDDQPPQILPISAFSKEMGLGVGSSPELSHPLYFYSVLLDSAYLCIGTESNLFGYIFCGIYDSREAQGKQNLKYSYEATHMA